MKTATLLCCALCPCCLALQPRETATRTIISLAGVWDLSVANRTLSIPVPSSYDELVPGLPEGFAGVANYSRSFRLPVGFSASTHRLVLRFESANYRAAVHVVEPRQKMQQRRRTRPYPGLAQQVKTQRRRRTRPSSGLESVQLVSVAGPAGCR